MIRCGNLFSGWMMEEFEKCYPTSHDDISICPYNDQGYCNRFDKECDNTQEVSDARKQT